MGFGPVAIAVVVAGICVYFYRNQSPPTFSEKLTSWIDKGKYMVHKDHRIFYREDLGKSEHGNPVVCLHGFPSLSYEWVKVWSVLQSKFSKVIAADFIGFGMSDKPYGHKYSIYEQADIVEALLKELNVQKVHVLAHDYGDTVAQELLARYNERKKRGDDGVTLLSVTLLNGGIFPETNFPRLSQKVMTVPYLRRVLSRLSNRFVFKKGFAEVFGPRTQPTDEEFQDFWNVLKHKDGYLIFPDILEYIQERQDNRERWVKALQEAQVPVSVIYGPDDPVNPPGFVDHYKKLVPGSPVTVLPEHISHYPQWEDPELTMKAFMDFIMSMQDK